MQNFKTISNCINSSFPEKEINMLAIKSNVKAVVAMILNYSFKERTYNFQIKKLNYPFNI